MSLESNRNYAGQTTSVIRPIQCDYLEKQSEKVVMRTTAVQSTVFYDVLCYYW